MDNILQLAMQMILCLIIAAVLGAFIGYLLGKISKCDKEQDNIEPSMGARKKELHDYEQRALAQKESKPDKNTKNLIASVEHEELKSTKEPKQSLSETIKKELHVGDKEPKPTQTQAVLKAFDGIEGSRPEILSSPVNGQADDLKEISGIGLKIEEALNELGIFHFGQIAAWTSENAKWIDNYLVFKGRVLREDWIGQAKLLAAGGSTEFSRKVKKGDHYK